MSVTQGPHRGFLPFGNPFRMMLPKGASLSPKLLDLLNTFEESLTGRLKQLKPTDKEDILRLSWMRSAIESLCGIHTDIKTLITALELPVSDWEDKWIDIYLHDSVKLLDICIAFSSEISRMKQGHLFLQYVLHDLGNSSSKQLVHARSSLDGWKHHTASKNPKFDNCFSIMDSLFRTIDLPKIKNSAKGKVLMRAMYGVKLVTLFICSTFAAAFSNSAKKLMDLQVSGTYLWVEAFADLQKFVNSEIRNIYSSGRITVVKELEVVDTVVKKLYPIVQDRVDPLEAEVLKNSKLDLEKSSEKLSGGLDLLAKEVDGFFQIVLTGRDALLCNLSVSGGNIPDQFHNMKSQVVR